MTLERPSIRRRLGSQLALLALALGIAACAPAHRSEPIYGPLLLTDEAAMAGQRVFYQHCHQCHPGGAGGLGFAINNRPLPGWLIRFQVRNGLGSMPAFSEEEISDAQLDDLVAFLLELRQQESPEGP